MSKDHRNTTSSKQERISRYQLQERFENVGWTTAVPPDLGEDFITNMYFKRKATGAAFYVQLKSITNFEQRKKKDHLPFRLEVEDIEHWRGFVLPVVLIIWDIYLEEGRWAFVDSLVTDLDRNRPEWKSQMTVTAHFPLRNCTDDDGLQRLRTEIGYRLWPLIAKGEPLEMQVTMAFETVQESQQKYEEWKKISAEGGQISFTGHTIQKVVYPEWWQPWAEEFDPDQANLAIIVPSPIKEFLVIVEMSCFNGLKVSLPELKLVVVKRNTETILLSSWQHSSLFQIEVSINRKDRKASYNVSFWNNAKGYDVIETLNLLPFYQAMLRGGKLSFKLLKAPDAPIELDVPSSLEVDVDPEYISLVHKLYKIQEKIGIRFQIPKGDILQDDLEAIKRLFHIVVYGDLEKETDQTYVINVETPRMLLGEDTLREGQFLFEVKFPESHVELFGMQIDTGPVTQQITGHLEKSYEELEKIISHLAPTEPLALSVHGERITQVYEKWYRGDESIKDLH